MGVFMNFVAKDRMRSWTTIIVAMPVFLFTSYGLFQRLVLGKERKVAQPAIESPSSSGRA
ncbi:hypothetical protein HDU96_003224 [Phlyctochytrium bullatum]|nr:hypothetical protein HDU96_003224 [Phlyctochytrium bullatum]